jgi:hypothetical protein
MQVHFQNRDEAYARAITIRMYRHRVPEAFARTQEAGHGIGRLVERLIGARLLTREQGSSIVDLAMQAAQTIVSYEQHVLGSPRPTPKGLDLSAVPGRSTATLTQDQVAAIRSRYAGLRQAVQGEAWYHLYEALIVDDHCDRWPPARIKILLDGLKNLSSGY